MCSVQLLQSLTLICCSGRRYFSANTIPQLAIPRLLISKDVKPQLTGRQESVIGSALNTSGWESWGVVARLAPPFSAGCCQSFPEWMLLTVRGGSTLVPRGCVFPFSKPAQMHLNKWAATVSEVNHPLSYWARRKIAGKDTACKLSTVLFSVTWHQCICVSSELDVFICINRFSLELFNLVKSPLILCLIVTLHNKGT